MTAKYPAQNGAPPPINLFRNHAPHPRRLDPEATRAIELLDLLHHSEDGHVLLPLYGGVDNVVRREVELNLKAAELLVSTRVAEWARPSKVGRRLRLAGVPEKELDEAGNYSQAGRSDKA